MESSVFDDVGSKHYFANLLDGRVDVVNQDDLKPLFVAPRPRASRAERARARATHIR